MNAPTSIAAALALVAPLCLLLAGLVPPAWARSKPVLVARLNGAAAWLAFACALAVAFAYAFGSARTWTLYSLEMPGRLGAFSVGAYVNAVTVIMLLLVSVVGALVSRYARNYLDGEPNQGRFHQWLSLTLAAILSLIVASNLMMFSLAWIATSLSLHQLLMFYRERPAAVLAAHKKFVASRIGDLSLLVAIFLIGSTLHTLEFEQMYAAMGTLHGPLPVALQWAAMLIVVSAALKSAQFPFHGWLVQVMEAPTPVSALLHAGIVNAGAFLVVRMSPIMSYSELALGTLAVIGLVTMALASLVMLTQTSIKVSLAWSTTAQMGFMLLECGLGLYTLAMLHLVAHSLYKAHAFLASGSGVDGFRAPAISYPDAGFRPARLIAALCTGILATLAVAAVFGITPDQQPALVTAGAIVAIAVSQLLLQAAEVARTAALLARSFALSVLVSSVYFALHAGFDWMLAGSVIPAQASNGGFHVALSLAVVMVFVLLLLIQQLLRHAAGSPRVGTLYVHLYNGLYIDVFFTRILQRLWPSPAPAPRVNETRLTEVGHELK